MLTECAFLRFPVAAAAAAEAETINPLIAAEAHCMIHPTASLHHGYDHRIPAAAAAAAAVAPSTPCSTPTLLDLARDNVIVRGSSCDARWERNAMDRVREGRRRISNSNGEFVRTI